MGGRGAGSSIAKGGWKLPKNARLIGTENRYWGLKEKENEVTE